jgi:hypothetical protein
MKFSERYGHKQVKNALQTDSMDQELRNALWSTLKIYYWNTIAPDVGLYRNYYISNDSNPQIYALCVNLWLYYFKQPLDTLSHQWSDVHDFLREYFFKCHWFEVYDFIEFVAQNHPEDWYNDQFVQRCNSFLEQEVSAYRFVAKEITKITSEEEISAIEEALSVKVSPVRQHVSRALELLSDRKKPDYRNSIKESISAVESLVLKLTESDKGTLGELLNTMDKQNKIHPALKQAFSKLYGYTSDADGIRHALLDEDQVTYEEAKFMLVACSAFINYVLAATK